ncbi:MAG: hypothetical protein M3328_18415 [Chloroflexota bacterium]|nr:hypothetical protein [Chloroflexota bacterium]
MAKRVAVKQACTVLFDTLPPLDSALLQAVLQPSVGPCSVEWATSSGPDIPVLAGVAEFPPHRIAMIALKAPVKREVLDRTVAVSPMPGDLREGLMAHRATVRLLYVGDAEEPVAQLTALYRVATALVAQGGLGVLNERAALAQPAELVASYLPQLGSEVPPLGLWVGAVTFNLGEGAGDDYLMRTYGMEQFSLPELGLYLRDSSTADTSYHILLNVCLYMVEGRGKLQMGAGNTVEFNKRTYLFTLPEETSPEFSSPSGLFLLREV